VVPSLLVPMNTFWASRKETTLLKSRFPKLSDSRNWTFHSKRELHTGFCCSRLSPRFLDFRRTRLVAES
jgi:hypothetical protein